MKVDNKTILEARTDQKAMENVLSEYKPLVTSISRRYFLVGAEPEDLVQEGMIGLYKAIQTFDESKQASFKTFANLCINSQIQMTIRNANRSKNKMLNEIMLEDNEEKMYLVVLLEPNPEYKVINQENFNYVKNEIISKLSLLEKQILKQFLLGKNYAEIAKTLCLDKKSVDNGLNRIRKKLIHLL